MRDQILLSTLDKGKWSVRDPTHRKDLLPDRESIAMREDDSAKELQEILINQEGLKKVKIESGLVEPQRGDMIAFLLVNTDVYAWRPEDMLGNPLKVMSHELVVDKHTKSVPQKNQHLGPERQKVIANEVKRLQRAGFI